MTSFTDSPATLTPARVRSDVTDLLGHDVDDHDDLFDEGLDSMRLMSLVERWRTAGSEAGFLDLVQRPTLAAWVELVANTR